MAERLQALPEVTGAQVLFGEQVAVRIEAPAGGLSDAAGRLGAMEGVASATLYRGTGRERLPATPA